MRRSLLRVALAGLLVQLLLAALILACDPSQPEAGDDCSRAGDLACGSEIDDVLICRSSGTYGFYFRCPGSDTCDHVSGTKRSIACVTSGGDARIYADRMSSCDRDGSGACQVSVGATDEVGSTVSLVCTPDPIALDSTWQVARDCGASGQICGRTATGAVGCI